jgi:hypothetical protein
VIPTLSGPAEVRRLGGITASNPVAETLATTILGRSPRFRNCPRASPTPTFKSSALSARASYFISPSAFSDTTNLILT